MDLTEEEKEALQHVKQMHEWTRNCDLMKRCPAGRHFRIMIVLAGIIEKHMKTCSKNVNGKIDS